MNLLDYGLWLWDGHMSPIFPTDELGVMYDSILNL